MCIIAGYSGNRPAAPILAEIMRKEEYVDGALSTGIATIHEGKLYYRKVTGDLETLLRETDALDLPGTTGIMHSRTGNDCVAHAHPFISNDGNIALITNGTMGEIKGTDFYDVMNDIARGFYEKGYEFKTALDVPETMRDKKVTLLPNGQSYMSTEAYLFMIEDALRGVSEENLRDALADATRNAIDTLPRNFITMNVHAKVPDTITIGNVARPITVGFAEGECFFASVPIALPDIAQANPVVTIPPTSVSRVTPKGVEILSTSLKNARVEQIDYRIAADMMAFLEEKLVGAEENPISVYDVLFGEKDWSDTWSKPHIDSIYAAERGFLKPYASLFYEALYAYHKQGRLHCVLGERKGHKITKFWADKI